MMKASAVVRIVLRPLAIGVEADVIIVVVSERERERPHELVDRFLIASYQQPARRSRLFLFIRHKRGERANRAALCDEEALWK